METIKRLAAEAAKAIIAVVTPIVVALIVDVFTELSGMAVGGITAAATGAAVYAVANRPRLA